MLQQTRYIDEKTGEVHQGRTRYIPPVFDEEKGYLLWPRKSGNRSFHDVPFPAELSFADKGRLLDLSKMIWRDTNMIGYRGNGGGRPYDLKKLAEVLELSGRQCQRFIGKMIGLGVIRRVEIKMENHKKEVQFYLNPLYFCSSKRVSLNLYLLFRSQLDPFLPGWVKAKFGEQKEKQAQEM